jgi:hypothetical protein
MEYNRDGRVQATLMEDSEPSGRWCWRRRPKRTTSSTIIDPLPCAADEVAIKVVKPASKRGLSFRKVFALSSEERPVLVLAVLLRFVSEGANMIIPLVLAKAYDAVVENYQKPEKEHETRRTITHSFILVLSLHVGGQLAQFLSSISAGMAGERVVSRLRRKLYQHLLEQVRSLLTSDASDVL